jgi:FkbM family methyltransferase
VDASVLVDVGANYGEVGLSCYRADTAVHLFEPHPRVIRYLRRTVHDLHNVTLHEAAASEQSGVALLRQPRNPYGLKWSGIASLEGGGRGVRVRTVRVDEVVHTTAADRIAFKVDVEGHELSVLRGMKTMLDACDRWVGMCET